jgi:hypothetical protein
LSKSSSFIFQFLSGRGALYRKFIRPAHCKDMGIITQRPFQAQNTPPLSTEIHQNPLLSVGFAVSFAVKVDREKALLERLD